MKSKFISTAIIAFTLLSIVFSSCVELTETEYDYQEDIIFIDAYGLSEPGLSTVSINTSSYLFQNYRVLPVNNAAVYLENIDTGDRVQFTQDSTGIYVCPPNFSTSAGETWQLDVELENGKRILSKPQVITAAIPIDDLKVEYSPEITYSAAFEDFIPGHRISIDWQDPPSEKNYYLWKYRTFEPLFVCKTCIRGIYRNGECQPNQFSFGPQYTDYLCDPTCWSILYGDELPIFEDQLSDGVFMENREITILPLYRRPDILIEIQQYSLDKSSYDYFKIINDQVGGNGGLNAPPPAGLLGNLYNPDDSEEVIFGQFTAAGVTTRSVYIDRSGILETPIQPNPPIQIETCIGCPTSFPCIESSSRTSIKPDGWP